MRCDVTRKLQRNGKILIILKNVTIIDIKRKLYFKDVISFQVSVKCSLCKMTLIRTVRMYVSRYCF